ncbi:hypothetical protein [Natronobiforma cellulositropha]|uniref:hypothetical protein n=1 Tax=Natronobiforma cellulositropha TaxID=1679076 RepID=UPI0021D5860D|nr:hypothetical protein [Natronobiforma cellulositropha]
METRTTLLYTAFGLATLTAVVHLVLGTYGLYEIVFDGASDILPPMFLIGAVLTVALIAGFVRGDLAPPIVYIAGAVLMLGHVIAYADWHVFGVAEATLGLENVGHDHSHDDHGHSHSHDDHGHGDDHGHDDGHGHDDHGHGHGDDHGHDDHGHGHGDDHGHSHDAPAHQVFIDHLVDDASALVTKTAETVSFLAFAALYVLER